MRVYDNKGIPICSFDGGLVLLNHASVFKREVRSCYGN